MPHATGVSTGHGDQTVVASPCVVDPEDQDREPGQDLARVGERVLAANDEAAARNRSWLAERGVVAVLVRDVLRCPLQRQRHTQRQVIVNCCSDEVLFILTKVFFVKMNSR